MVDIHHHLLFGLDDGSTDLNTSIQMAQMAAADGITHIVCTPHASNDFEFRPDENSVRFAALEAKILEAFDGKLTLGIGCDFHLSYENITDAIQHPTKYTINHKNYLLIEFPNMGIAPAMPDFVKQLIDAGIKPIITHPERNPTFTGRPEKLDDYTDMGCLIQITGGSILGGFGRNAQRFSMSLLEANRVDIVASDAHDLERRPPQLRSAFEAVSRTYGEALAQRIFITTPRAAFYGEPLPSVSTIAPSVETQQKKRGVFSRFFSQ